MSTQRRCPASPTLCPVPWGGNFLKAPSWASEHLVYPRSVYAKGLLDGPGVFRAGLVFDAHYFLLLRQLHEILPAFTWLSGTGP